MYRVSLIKQILALRLLDPDAKVAIWKLIVDYVQKLCTVAGSGIPLLTTAHYWTTAHPLFGLMIERHYQLHGQNLGT